MRLKRLKLKLKGAGVDGFLVSDINNIRYLSGFTGSSAYLLVTQDKSWFLTDSRYASQAQSEVRGYRTRVYRKSLETIAELASSMKIKTLAFEGGNLSYDNFLKVKKAFRKTRLKSLSGVTSALRTRKEPVEISLIKDSVKALDKGYVTAQRVIAPGVREKDAALSIELAFRDSGADATAFDTIIASGFRGALPHGKASGKKIKKGELVVVDMGVILNGYNSDETRTYCVGRATAEQKKVYGVVLGAQERAIERIRPGVKAAEVDRAAREYIEKAGYGEYFGHGLGHGVGLEVHEGPSLSPFSDDLLEEGMVVTVEPGIYIPEWGGVRIEDMVHVVKGGSEVLTKTPKDFVCL
ncbi:MAG: aminopeptidase P family protein [Deltaproteobacteria bacterium]|nr:aminopeptidase P family protein [Deltaproteobacteria bacterium]